MAFSAEEIWQEAQTFIDGAGQSQSAYLHMLDGIAKYHKYTFEQQAVLAYGPSFYTAVADRQIWEEFFHVQIKESASGVAIPNEKSPIAIKIVYDVSETEGWPDGKQPDLLWHFDAEQDSSVFRGVADENVSSMDGLLQTCWNIEDSFVGSEKSGEERLLLSASLAYVLMKRLGFSREAEIHAEQTITDELLNSVKNVSLQEISDISREILNGIQDYVQKGKGRDSAFPLEPALERVGIYAKATVAAEPRQEISSVEAPAPEAADATKEAAEPTKAGASPEPPAQMAETDDSSSVSAPEQDFFMDDYLMDHNTNIEGLPIKDTVLNIPKKYKLNVVIHTIEKDGKYYASHNYELRKGSYSGGGFYPDSSRDPSYDTEQEAIEAAIKVVAGLDAYFCEVLYKSGYRFVGEPQGIASENASSGSAVMETSATQEISAVEAPVPEAADATEEAAEPTKAGASPEPPSQMAATDDSSSVAAMDDSPENTGKTLDDVTNKFRDMVNNNPYASKRSIAEMANKHAVSVEEYLRLAGIQVIPDTHKEELLALARENASDDDIHFGKYAVINGIDVKAGSLSITIVDEHAVTTTTFPDNAPDKLDHVLRLLDVNMDDFREAYAKYDGTNLEEVALPLHNPPFTWDSYKNTDNLIYSPFLSTGASSDWPKEGQLQQEFSNVESGVKYHGGKKGDAFQRNVAAITTLKTLELNPAFPMSSEQRYALLDYSGFGNLPEVFDAKNKNWQPEHDVLEKVLTREEYAAARASVLNSYYTDPAIVAAVFQGLAGMGFKKGNILEPSCGVGNFFRAMPEDIRKESHLFGVELDPISGRIARQLYPDVNISIQGFETTTYPEGSFDLAITNVPFENYKIHGYSIHDYFLLKMAQQVRPGGLMVAITSRYSMDKKDSSAREELARRAELIKAIRLPNTAFREAGAEATTDLLIFRRREHYLEYGAALPSWVNVVPFEGNSDILVNPYFLQHPEDVIGHLEKKSTAYGFDLTCKPVEGKRETGEIAAEIAKAMASVRAEYVPAKDEMPLPEQEQPDNAMPYSFFVDDGDEVRFRDTDSKHIKTLTDLGIEEKDKAQLLHLIRLRDLTRDVIRVQQSSESDEALAVTQEHLNAVYDDYVEVYGDLHSKKAKQLFKEDCSYPLLMSLERTDEKGNVISKSDIFTTRTIRPHIPPSHVDTAQEALIVSMTEHGKVDIPYMEFLTGRNGDELIKELEYREMFWNFRARAYQSADEYLSGDIREKMEWLEKNIEVTRILRDRDIWDSLIPPMHANDVDYVPKNETEERILDKGTSYRFTDMAHDYIKGSQDWPFFFEYLKNFDAAYHLPDTVTSDPLFVLEAGLCVGNAVDDTEGLVVLSDVVSAMNILGLEMKKQPPRHESPVLKFLYMGTEKEYPQKRACIHYLRNILKEYDGTNARALADRAGQEWPSVWQDWKKKFDATLEKGELFGLANFNEEIERGEKNLVALKAVCPKDLTAEEISVRLGTPWVPPSDIETFMHDLFGASEKVVYSNVNHGEWYIQRAHSRSSRFDVSRPMAKSYSTPEYDALALLELTLNLRQAVVKKTVYVNGEERQVIDQEKTVLAQQKQEMLKEAFATWVWQDESRKERLVSYYNRHFNNIRPREYDGSHLEFPGMNPEIRLRPHQKDAIAHTLYGGNTLLAHCVGAGKSFEMIASIMESKRLGLSTKAMLVVPGHLTEQMGAEFMRLYPTANILVATKKDFEKAHRKEFCAKIATHNWDAVILGFTQFEKVAMSRAYIEQFTRDEINRLAAEIAIAKEKEGKSFDIRQMERLRKSLEGKLAAMEDKKPKDDVIDFEALGIDRLYVDEAHNFKNLGVITKMTRLPGISTAPAQKSTDFYQKVQYLNNKTNGKGLVFATGTAISNSMTELYVMQQYLQPDRLESEGVRHFDTWATTFGEISDVQEISPEGKGLRVRQRFTKFCNLPELMSMVKEVADIKTEDMLDLPTPNVEYHVESVPASPEQKAMVDELADRAMKIRNKSVDTSLPENNMLAVTGEGRKLALDQRLMNPDLPDYPDSKVNRCVGNIFRIWQETAGRKGTQLVFSDLSTPDGSKFNVYDDIKNKLIAKGVPEEEIAFIHDANNEKQKEELFAKVRAGKVRVLLGSTGKLGTGTNVQDKLVASHDLDVPWKPSDLEQRKGRIARQGNENEKVDVYRYVTEGTFDSYMWQLLENKQRFISQVLTSKAPARVTEDMDELTLSCAEVKAIASGSPLVREKLELGVEVERLKIARRGFLADMDERKWYVDHRGKENIEAFEKRKKHAVIDRDALKNYVPEQKGVIITLGDKSFTDAKEAGKAIVEAIRSGHGEELRGSYKGMTFSLHSGFDWHMELSGLLTFSANVHMGDYAENLERLKRIEEQILQLPERIDEAIQDEQRKIEETRSSLGQSFPQEAEYQQKLARLEELDVLLNEENTKEMDIINQEVRRRYDALKIVVEDGDYLESAYAEKALKKVRKGVEWSAEVDREIARELFADGFDRKEIAAMLMQRSPKIYDADTAEAIVSSGQKLQRKTTACR